MYKDRRNQGLTVCRYKSSVRAALWLPFRYARRLQKGKNSLAEKCSMPVVIILQQGGLLMLILACTEKRGTHNNDECRGIPSNVLSSERPCATLVDSSVLENGTDARVAVA